MDHNTKLMIAHTRLSHTLMVSLGKNIEELGLVASSYSILDYLNNMGMVKTQSLCKVALLTSGSVTHMVNQLVKKGYVRKIPCQIDKRVSWVEITEEGREVFLRIQTEHLKYLAWLFEDFSDQEKMMMKDQMKYFGTTIEKKLKGE